MNSLSSRVARFVAPVLLGACAQACDSSSLQQVPADMACRDTPSPHALQEVSTRVSTAVDGVLHQMRQIVENPDATVFDGKLYLEKESGKSYLGEVRALKIGKVFTECHTVYGNALCQMGELAGHPESFIVTNHFRVLVEQKSLHYGTPDFQNDMALAIESDGTCMAFEMKQWSTSCSSGQETCVSSLQKARTDTFTLLNDFGQVVHD